MTNQTARTASEAALYTERYAYWHGYLAEHPNRPAGYSLDTLARAFARSSVRLAFNSRCAASIGALACQASADPPSKTPSQSVPDTAPTNT